MSRSHTKSRRRERQRQQAKLLATLVRMHRSGQLTDDEFRKRAGREPPP